MWYIVHCNLSPYVTWSMCSTVLCVLHNIQGEWHEHTQSSGVCVYVRVCVSERGLNAVWHLCLSFTLNTWCVLVYVCVCACLCECLRLRLLGLPVWVDCVVCWGVFLEEWWSLCFVVVSCGTHWDVVVSFEWLFHKDTQSLVFLCHWCFPCGEPPCISVLVIILLLSLHKPISKVVIINRKGSFCKAVYMFDPSFMNVIVCRGDCVFPPVHLQPSFLHAFKPTQCLHWFPPYLFAFLSHPFLTL